MKNICILIILNFIFGCTAKKLVRQKRTLVFPSTSCYGAFVAIAVPLDNFDKNVFVSYSFASNYVLVSNTTEIDEVLFPNIRIISSWQGRRFTRELAYKVLESKFNHKSMNGKQCMLRNICEAAETPLDHNGILGHLMHFIFTPSVSREEGVAKEYYEAEVAGHRGDCDQYVEKCPTSLFDYITRLVEFPHNS